MKKIFQEKTDYNIHAGEAYVFWTQLQAWYDVFELTELYISYTKDIELKLLLETGNKLVKRNIGILEESMKKFHIAFPPRPAEVVRTPSDTENYRDELMFRIIFDISQSSLLFHAKAINICMNDSFRNIFMNFLNDEMHAYDNIVKFGKRKGWVHFAPVYKQ